VIRHRFVFPAALAVLAGGLLLPGWAPASTVSTANYQGDVAPSGSVSFDAKLRDGVVKRIMGNYGPPPTGLTFGQLPVTCDEGASQLDLTIVSNLRVQDHRFHVIGKTVDPALHGKVRAHGLFTDDYSSVSGIVRAHGNFGDAGTNCESGKLTWTAAVQTAPSGGARAAKRSSSLLLR
jgi:hypothetical protein